MKDLCRSRIYLLMAMLSILFINACGGGGGGGGRASIEEINPCPENAPKLAPGSEEGTYLFYAGCGLWALDPAKPSEPAQVTPDYIQGSLQRLIGGTWDPVAKKIQNQALHTLIYAAPHQHGDGVVESHFFKVSAKLSNPIKPTQVSSEAEADRICGVIALLEDYADLNNSLYVYTMPGPDQLCGLADDNIEKFIRIGMGAEETEGNAPVQLPPNREVFTLSDLVNPDTGAIMGWLAIKPRRKQRVLPAYEATTDHKKKALVTPYKEIERDRTGQLKETPKGLGFLRGTPVMLSGAGSPGGLDTDTIYIVDSSPTTNIPFECPEGGKRLLRGNLSFAEALNRIGLIFAPGNLPFKLVGTEVDVPRDEVHLKKLVKKLCLENGEILKIDFDASDAALAQLKADLEGHQVKKAIVVEEGVKITSNNPVKINRVATYNDLHRCDLSLINCTLIKETRFKTFCAVEGLNLMGNEGETLKAPFLIEASDHKGNPIFGEEVHWRRGDQEDDEDDLETTLIGEPSFTGTLGSGPKVGWESFSAKISGAGAPLGFKADTKIPGDEETQDVLPPSCRRREEYFIAGVFPQPTRGSRALFSGKIVLRIDLLYKPDPGNRTPEKANKGGTMGILYLYDTQDGSLSTTDPDFESNRPSLFFPALSPFKYLSIDHADGTTAAFPDHLPFVYDAEHYFFADRGKLYALPLSDSGEAVLLADERPVFDPRPWQFVELKLAKDHLVYSLIDRSVSPPFSKIKSILRIGGSSDTLFGRTQRFFLPIISDAAWERVYFQSFQAKIEMEPPYDSGIESVIYSTKVDGTEPISTTHSATLAGRSRTRVFSIINCEAVLFTCKTTPTRTGQLISVDGATLGDQQLLGDIPSNIDNIYFDGFGDDVLGEGFADSEIDNVEIFFIRGNQAGSLTKTTETPLVPEAIL